MGFSKLQVAATAAFAALLAVPQVLVVNAQASAWHFDALSTLMMARLDPIVAENKAAGHMHRIWGGNNFAAAYSYENSRKGNCSSVYAQADMSNYWVPELYVTEQDASSTTNTYTAVPSVHRFYYFLDRNAHDIPVAAFPEGLKMIVGNQSAKSYEETGLPLNALIYTCQTPNEAGLNVISDNFNFPKSCPELKTEIKFPSCWDGKNLWLEGMAHMAYPQRTLYGPCPYSHPIRIPAIMVENTWKIQDTDGSGSAFKGRLIWANGDTTGYGFHADFTNGWDTATLTKALNDPNCLLNKSIAAELCPSLGITVPADIAVERACRPLNGFVNETGSIDHAKVDKLPGCNLPWSSGTKPKCSNSSPLPDINAFLGVTSGANVVPEDRGVEAKAAPKGNTWAPLGCMDAYVLDLGNKTMWHNWRNMTNQNCHAFCGEIGFPYAATTLGYQCMCGKNMNTASYHNDDNKCGFKCTGDDVNCGSDGFYNLYNNPAVALAGPKQPKASDKSYLGCYMSGTIQGNLSPIPEDVDTCRTHCKSFKYFALNNARYCNCANDFSNPQALETRVAEFSCQATCDSNSAQICGGNVEGTFYDSVYLVDGNFDAAEPVGTATTVSSEVPTGTASGADLLTSVAGQAANRIAVVVTSIAKPSVAATMTSHVTTWSSPVVNKMVASEVSSHAAVGFTAAPETPETTTPASKPKTSGGSPVLAVVTSSSLSLDTYSDCEIVTKTVTVTAKASDIRDRHFARRSRRHLFDIWN